MKIILLSHGTFSQGLQNSAEMILGKQENLLNFSILENCDTDSIKSEIIEELEKAKLDQEHVLFLTDLFFGTPFNIITPLMEKYEFWHVTGINLPLLLEILSNRDADNPAAMLKEAIATAKEAMVDCVDYFNKAMN